MDCAILLRLKAHELSSLSLEFAMGKFIPYIIGTPRVNYTLDLDFLAVRNILGIDTKFQRVLSKLESKCGNDIVRGEVAHMPQLTAHTSAHTFR